jgi:hypothetical protein
MDHAPTPAPTPEIQPVVPSGVGRGLLIAHIVNLILIIVVFLGTHYYLSANQCAPDASFRWSVISAAIYGLLSAILLSSWLHHRRKK